MKTKLILISIVLTISATIASSYNCSNNQAQNRNKNQKIGLQNNENGIPNVDTLNSKNHSSIECYGKIFDKFPVLDSFENKSFANILNKINKVEIKVEEGAPYQPFYNDIQQYIFANFKNNIATNEGYLKFDSRIDGEKITWAPVAMLPTNGKFVMIILAYWEKEAYEPASTGFYLSSFSLKGKMLSMAYIYGYEEFNNSYNNKNIHLSSIWGRVYCMNTNQPKIRKAVNWDSYLAKGGLTVTTLEVKEIQYSIDEDGLIKSENEKIIFPRTKVQWEDRAKVSFESGSDTIRKMLGEIE